MVARRATFINFHHKRHLTKEWEMICIRQEIDLYTAVLGGDITVDTLHGKVKLKIAPGTQNNSKTRLKGKRFSRV